MPTFLDSRSFYYGDVNLIGQPQYGVRSREIDIPRDLGKIIVSPMSAVVGERFAVEAVNLGLGVCLHRFDTIENQKKALTKLYDTFGKEEVMEWKDIWVSVGLDDWRRVEELGHKSVLIDVANGYLGCVASFAQELQKKGYRVMAGNVHSGKGINMYHNCRVRVGIGNGTVCKTSDVTGYNRGQVTEILECVRERYSSHQMVVADGGIKTAGDAAKAFGLGADYVMMGGFFALAEEAENVRKGEFKYWGGASETQQVKQHGKARRHSEGSEITLDKKEVKPLSALVNDLWGGISSAISYSGYRNLTQFIGNGVFEFKKS